MAKGKKTGGRQKGTPNKMSKALKDMILSALDKAGGEDYLYDQAMNNPNAFLTLVGKVIPGEIKAELTGKDGEPLSKNFGDTERASRLLFLLEQAEKRACKE